MFGFLWPHGYIPCQAPLFMVRILEWVAISFSIFSGKDTGVGCHFLLQGIFLDPGIKSRSPALQAESLLSDSLGKPYPNWKCRSKIACVDNGILYTENLKYYIKKTCYINQSIRKIAGYKKVYNNILHCHTNNILLEREIKEKIRMIVASKRIIYLGINWPRAEISVYWQL